MNKPALSHCERLFAVGALECLLVVNNHLMITYRRFTLKGDPAFITHVTVIVAVKGLGVPFDLIMPEE